jgi:hypothetical protein
MGVIMQWLWPLSYAKLKTRGNQKSKKLDHKIPTKWNSRLVNNSWWTFLKLWDQVTAPQIVGPPNSWKNGKPQSLAAQQGANQYLVQSSNQLITSVGQVPKPWFRTDPLLRRFSVKESVGFPLRCYPSWYLNFCISNLDTQFVKNQVFS